MEEGRRFRVRWHGGFVVEHLDGTPIAFPTRKIASLAARLIYHGDERHRRAALAGELWPHVSGDKALSSLRHALSTLRSRLGEGVVVTDGSTVKIVREAFQVAESAPSLPFAPEFDDDWAECVRVRVGVPGCSRNHPPQAPIREFLTTLDYLTDLDPAGAVGFATSAAPVLDEAPLDLVVPRLERLLERSPPFDEGTMRLQLMLVTKYHLQSRLVDAARCLRNTIRVAGEMQLEELMQGAAYSLFATWVLLGESHRAPKLLSWLENRGNPATRLAAGAMWSFQRHGGDSASRQLGESASAARVEGQVALEQRALASLLACGAPTRLEGIVERLQELHGAASAGIGTFAFAFAQSLLLRKRERSEEAIQTLADAFTLIRARGESRLALGTLLYLSRAYAQGGHSQMAAQCLGAARAWREEIGAPWLPSEVREQEDLRCLLESAIGAADVAAAVERGERMWMLGSFVIP